MYTDSHVHVTNINSGCLLQEAPVVPVLPVHLLVSSQVQLLK